MVPGVKQLVFQEHLGNVILRGRINDVSQGVGPEGNKEVSDLLDHGVAGVTAPFSVLELVVSGLFNGGELENDVPADSVSWGRESAPLY